MNADEAFIAFFGIYLCVMVGALFGIYALSRPWRIVIYTILGAGHLFVNFVLYELSFINVNNDFSEHTLQLFTQLAEQLAQGVFQEELLTPPSLAIGCLLSAFGVLALIGGLASVWLKPRWWTWLAVCLGLLLSSFAFSFPQRKNAGDGIAEQNELRRNAYEVVRRKREEGVSNTILSEAINSQLKDFHGTYENRTDAKESAYKILAAINEL